MCDDPATLCRPLTIRNPSMGLAVVDSMAIPHFKAFLVFFRGFYPRGQ
jgi:hypothetical protein